MAKIEVVKQQDLQDCGACSLACIIKYYDGYVPLEKIRDDTCTSSNGTTAYHLIEAAKSYGFEALGVKVDDVKDKNTYFPAIAHVTLKNGLNHFVVIYKISKNYVYLMDPAIGKTKMKLEDFENIWNHILILFTPFAKIIKYDKNVTVSSLLFNLILKNKYIFINICFINLIVMLFTILTSFYFQIAVSSINLGQDNVFLKVIIIIFTLTYLFKVILNFIKNYYLVYFYKNLDVELFSDFLEHIFNLPLKFMQNRSTGEIISRVQDLSEIKELLAELFTNVLLNMVLVIGSMVVLYSLNSKLFLILCLVITIYVIGGLLFSKLIYRCVKDNIKTTTDFNSALVENIEVNTSIKNLGLIKPFYKRLEEKLIIMFRSNFKTQTVLNNISLVKDFIYEMGIFLVISLGIMMIYQNNLELLTLITFHSLIFYLTDPIQDFINLIPKYNFLKATFNKLSEFISIKEEEDTNGIKEMNSNSIEFCDVFFSYNLTPILKQVSFKINAGEKVFLKGPSGSGKSTICNLMISPSKIDKGIINVGETNIGDYKLSTTLKNILYVGQNEKLITGTIRENIICFRNISDDDFKLVTKICRIESIVEKRPNRYEAMINAMQNNLSGGELQRIILARGLLKNAKILVLDEALSEVNFELELEIIEDIKKYYSKSTLIYVSHKDVSKSFKKILDMGELNGKFVSE